MVGRPIPTESQMRASGYGSAELAQRRAILGETLGKLATPEVRAGYHRLAAKNLERWQQAVATPEPVGQVLVVPGDWGDVTLQLTKRYGAYFATLNMANAFVPGGGYVEGLIAQEENMYRRTDCHFHIRQPLYDPARDCYLPEMTQLLTAVNGKVYLDTQQPRVCIRGSEDRGRDDLGYPWLESSDVFSFAELRASAQDLRDGSPFNADRSRQQIAAQLDTLRAANQRYAVLGAFGCGAFMNPAAKVARLYREEIDRRRGDFAVIAFAIFAAGYGPGNYEPFAAELC